MFIFINVFNIFIISNLLFLFFFSRYILLNKCF